MTRRLIIGVVSVREIRRVGPKMLLSVLRRRVSNSPTLVFGPISPCCRSIRPAAFRL